MHSAQAIAALGPKPEVALLPAQRRHRIKFRAAELRVSLLNPRGADQKFREKALPSIANPRIGIFRLGVFAGRFLVLPVEKKLIALVELSMRLAQSRTPLRR